MVVVLNNKQTLMAMTTEIYGRILEGKTRKNDVKKLQTIISRYLNMPKGGLVTAMSRFENSPKAIVFVCPITGRILSTNHEAEKLYGYSKQQMSNMNIQNVSQLTLQQYRWQANLVINNHILHLYSTHKMSDGSMKDVVMHVGPARFNGKRVCVVVIRLATPLDVQVSEMPKQFATGG